MTTYDQPPAKRRLPRTDEEWLEYVQRDDVDSIRSRSDWDRRLRDGDFRGKLFPGCDDETVEEFSNGLVFRDGVFAGADYSMLADKLTYKQVYKIWADAFHMPEELVPDHDGYACHSPHTCSTAVFSICMSAC